jgi:hypothetical protein
MMIFGKELILISKKKKINVWFFFRLRIFKLQAQIICNEMPMSNDEVQEYQVEFFLIRIIQ